MRLTMTLVAVLLLGATGVRTAPPSRVVVERVLHGGIQPQIAADSNAVVHVGAAVC
jgi:hypothetical protein